MASQKSPSTAKIGLFTGSFDPLTNGHADIIVRASRLFDSLYVGIFDNPDKTPLIPRDARQSAITEVTAPLGNVTVITARHVLSADIARELGVTALVRAIRGPQDTAYEQSLDWFNHELAGLETILLIAKPELQYLSSSHVKELLHYHQDLSKYLPAPVLKTLQPFQ